MSKPECKSKQAAKRRPNGTFAPGTSGNPGGRSPAVKEIRAKLEKGSKKVADAVIAAASGGDMQAARLVLERIVPASKPVSDPISFEIDQTDLPSTARSILAAIAAGQIPPDQGKALIDSVAAMARITEIAELEQQLIELRELMEGRQ